MTDDPGGQLRLLAALEQEMTETRDQTSLLAWERVAREFLGMEPSSTPTSG